MRRAAAAAALLLAIALAACGVKAPPRPPAEAKRAPSAQGGASKGSELGSGGADAAAGPDCGPGAAREQGKER
jgi:predicted small lipoprotein YifL